MSNLPITGLRVVDNSGVPLNGAKLYTYAAGTVNNKATYPTEADLEALTNVHANPVESDANGWFPEIYLLKDAAYKLVLKTSAGVTIKTWDNVNCTALRGADLSTRMGQIASNPLDYGAIGDGVADESAEVQDAIDAATGVVDLLGKTFRCDSALSLAAGITLRNGTLDFANCPDDEYIVAAGSLGAANVLTGNVSALDVVLPVTSVAGLAAGDWLMLKDDVNWSTGGDDHSETVQIKSIAALNVTITEPLVDGYLVASNAAVYKLSPVADVRLENLKITCSAAAAGAGRAVYASVVERFYCENVFVDSPKGTGIEVRDSVGASMQSCTVQGDAVTGVGYEIACRSRNVAVTDCRAMNLATGFRTGTVDATDGVVRNVQLRNIGAYGCTTGLNIQLASDEVSYSGEIVTDTGGTGVTDNGTRSKDVGVSVRGATTGIGTFRSVYEASGTITSANITGVGAGQFGHADGVAVVAAPGAGKALVPISCYVAHDYSTAAYGAGGTINLRWGAAASALVGCSVAGAPLLTTASDQIALATGDAVGTESAASNYSNTALRLTTTVAFTNPGTAAGVLRWRVLYTIIETGL